MNEARMPISFFHEPAKVGLQLGKLVLIACWQKPAGRFVSRCFTFEVLWC